MRTSLGSIIALALLTVSSLVQAADGQLTLTILDKATGKPVACRVHLKNNAGVPRKVNGMPFWFDHLACPGELKLKLPKGNYTFVIERGLEYVDVNGYFTMVENAEDTKTVELNRACHMADEGWWSGDLYVCRPLKEIEPVMQSEDLHVAGVVTWDNKKSQWPDKGVPSDTTVAFDQDRFYHTMIGKDSRAGGSVLFYGLSRPLDVGGLNRDYPPSLDLVSLAAQRDPSMGLDVAQPFAWDLPLWLASGKVRTIELANSHMLRNGMTKNEAGGKPRDKAKLRDPLGNGVWSEMIYYHVLNSGLRIPPSAGSGSGEANNPVGYNRVYAYVPKDQFTIDAWWSALNAGRTVVTNGPLIRPIANDERPGHVFRVPAGGELEVDVAMNLTTRDKLGYLDIVYNGRVASSIRLEEWAQTGHFPPLKIKQSGWFLVRVVTQNEETYRFASSAPWYVEVGDTPHVSRRSAQFFLDWVNERGAMIKLADADEQAGVLRHIDMGRKFWQAVVGRATVE